MVYRIFRHGRSLTCLYVLFLGLRAVPVWAVPACPETSTVTQPDGTQITIRLRGDEHFHWTETRDGYLVAKVPKTGHWVYATLSAGAIVPTEHIVGKVNPQTLTGITPDRKSFAAIAADRQLAQTSSSSQLSALTAKTGIMRNLVVLVNFSDQAITFSRQDFDDLFNLAGYTADGASGSVQDFYHQVSFNTLTVQSTVVEAVTLDHGYAYYGANDPQGDDLRPREMVQEALAKLAARGFDFSTMDGDGDGWVDGLDIIHAGGGEEYSGNDANYIWSHQWALSSPVTYNGVQLQPYHTEPARRGFDAYPTTQGITRIGVICHETAHFLGLPDLYDTTYTSKGVGNFCLMANGSWNGNYGSIPSYLSAWCRYTLGWSTPTPLTTSGTYSLTQVETSGQIYKLQGSFTSEEYFLIENRQGIGFDSALPGTARGMLIWHIDENQSNNDTKTHYLVDLEEASGTQHLELNQNNGEDTDYFRVGNAVSFTDTTTPNNLSYSGRSLGIPILAIGNSGATMSFTITVPPAVPVDEDFETGNFSRWPWTTGGNANWTTTFATMHTGSYSAKAGIISNNQSSWLQVTLTRDAGDISFFRRVSSESNHDFLRFKIDGIEMEAWSGEQAWSATAHTYAVTVGTHTYRWEYTKDTKDKPFSSGSDTAWIDDITFPPSLTYTVTGTITYPPFAAFPLNTVSIELRDAGGNLMETHPVTLTGTEGAKTYTFTTPLSGGPYILAIPDNPQTGWFGQTITNVTLNASSATIVDFTSLVHAVPGDANLDQRVDISDLGILSANYESTATDGWASGDFNGDTTVNVGDLGILAANYGTGTGNALDFNEDLSATGLAVESEVTPLTNKMSSAISPVGCSSIGLPLLAGLTCAALMLGRLKIKE